MSMLDYKFEKRLEDAGGYLVCFGEQEFRTPSTVYFMFHDIWELLEQLFDHADYDAIDHLRDQGLFDVITDITPDRGYSPTGVSNYFLRDASSAQEIKAIVDRFVPGMIDTVSIRQQDTITMSCLHGDEFHKRSQWEITVGDTETLLKLCTMLGFQ